MTSRSNKPSKLSSSLKVVDKVVQSSKACSKHGSAQLAMTVDCISTNLANAKSVLTDTYMDSDSESHTSCGVVASISSQQQCTHITLNRYNYGHGTLQGVSKPTGGSVFLPV